jgi:hypothetical protein
MDWFQPMSEANDNRFVCSLQYGPLLLALAEEATTLLVRFLCSFIPTF